MSGSPGRSIRTFVAVEVDEAVRERLGRAVRELAPRVEAILGKVRWVAAEQYHFTLRFLGPLSPRQVEKVAQATARACAQSPAFEVQVRGLGAFPDLDRPRVLWVGVDEAGGERLCELARRVESALSDEGFGPADRPFSPHLTVGRVLDGARTGAGPALEAIGRSFEAGFGAIRAHCAVVMKSELKPTGPVYTVLRRLALGRG